MDAVERGFHAIRDLDRVRARLPLDREHDRRARRSPSSPSCCSGRRRSHGRHRGGGPARRCGTRRSCRRNDAAVGQLAAGLDGERDARPPQDAGGDVDVLALTAVFTSSRPMPREASEPVGRAGCAPRISACHRRAPGRRRSPSRAAARSSSRRTRRASRAAATCDVSARVEDRGAGGVGLLVRGRDDALRQRAQRLRDRGLNVLRGGVDVAVERELHDDLSWSRGCYVDVMLSMPAIVENCFSSGVATVDGHGFGARARQRAPSP